MAKLPATAVDDVKGTARPPAPPVPGKPVKQRRFPWRLWLYALFMTAAAGAGGYFTWSYRGEAIAADEQKGTAAQNEKVATDALDAQKQLVASCADQGKAKDTQIKEANDRAKEANAKVAAEVDKAKQLQDKAEMLSKTLNATSAQRAEIEKRIAAVEDIQKQFAKMIDTGALKVTTRRGNLVLSLPAEVLFPSGVADLSKDGELKVLEVGITLKKFPDRRFMVIGHSDNQPPGKGSLYRDNWELSTARALTVTRFLVQAGMSPKNLVAAGAGEHDPIAGSATAADLARNRRIEIALLPAINELPPLPPSLAADAAKDAKDGKDGKDAPKP
ncbi:MAG: OmpA family protein [Deltaproteobacteria bacterium]|nr:OmpA family protein [Deltaproteobacteria bacterium]